MNEKQVRVLIEKVLSEKTQNGGKTVLPQGYNPLEIIRGAMFHLVPVPFNGTPVWCELRCLNATQILALGNFSNIDRKETDSMPSRQQLIELRNYQEKLIRAVMNKPVFDEIAALVGIYDFVIKDKRKELEEIIENVKQHGESWSKQQQLEVKKQIDDLELFMGFILPEDTFGFLTAWAHGNDISDIKKISDDQLLEAAILAENGKDNPHDHIRGVFTDHNMRDIDIRAWALFEDYKNKKSIEKNARMKRR
ncbi:MAG: hypothetical protein FWD26_04985 [Treponema sp.]|nr:hypothetical protein [Treponema sp.]